MSKEQHAPGALERVRAFVNTIDIEQDAEQLEEPAALAGWLVEHQLAPRGLRATHDDLDHALELREALRALLLAHNGAAPEPAQALEALDDAVCRANVRLRFRAGGEASLEPQADGVPGALGRLLVIVQAAVADGSWPRLKACREHACEWAFYDHTRNHSGAWCNMRVCGNRAKARAFRQRQSRGSLESH
ncbi:MAG: CGNR zinc finger domain-containing protein [Actinomycetota bacterium]|nr:CGNR zinc finger domain-containing protein [Actinomycetota bacterium]